MQRVPLLLSSGHLIATIDDDRWVLDTGSPASFGREETIELDSQHFKVASGHCGIEAESLSTLVGEPLAGLIGADILNHLDIEIDLRSSKLSISQQPIDLVGIEINLNEFMGVPIVQVQSDDGEHSMFFDTGAQISYFQNENIGRYKAAGEVRDFFPGMGEFYTETHIVEFRMHSMTFSLRCGRLPDLLGLTLGIAGVQGIVGNEICNHKIIGYFARRKLLVLA